MKELPYAEFARQRTPDQRLLDVREEDEFAEVHVKGAELFPLSRLREGELPESDDREIFVICRSGGRSAVACKILEAAGFQECTNIAGGTTAAIAEGDDHLE
jgi:rhodanese-related sulfurtransferase